jgi:hypothetical protein
VACAEVAHHRCGAELIGLVNEHARDIQPQPTVLFRRDPTAVKVQGT